MPSHLPPLERNPVRAIVCATAAAVLVGVTACSGPSSGVPTPGPSSGASTSTPSSPAAPDAARFQATIDEVRTTVGFPGAVVGVWGPDSTWVGTTGTAGPGEDRAPSRSDHTRVGSLTKTMTATLLLQLVQERKVSLDDPISTYVKDVPNGSATLRQLADMTSGIPIYTAQPTFLPAILADPARGWTPDELLGYVENVKPDAAPGAAWAYNNTNYVLLGLVIEKVTGRPIAEVFQERIFDPLGMTSSSFPGPTTDIPQPYLSGVTAQGQPAGKTVDSTHWNPSFAFTAGEVISTFDDLKKWADALFTGERILDPATQQLRRDSILTSPPPNTATSGYGIGIGNMNGWWGHDGDIFGYTTSVFHNYDLDTTIVIVTNSDAPQPDTDPPAVAAPALLHALEALLR
jgi:D-alanyl-D-alanine carboxypeptidase